MVILALKVYLSCKFVQNKKNDGRVFFVNTALFSHIYKISKSAYQLRHVCLSAWKNSVPTGYIFIKFDI
jgi:hypothetical protein